ncbi:unnamed protein product, partial [Timema podura]|nr:unnamed protein product [Timema podura]
SQLKSALPAIDAAPPVARAHVCCKLKKVQREEENTARIEKDNFRLLRRMGAIMSHNRLDNHWITPPPNFLRRVGIYKPKVIPLPESPETPPRTQPSTRKSRCLACSTQSLKESLEQKQSNTRSVSTSTTNQSK